MRRRKFIALVGSAVVAVPIARAQQLARIPRLGVLLYSTPQADPQIKFVLQGLRDLGYLEAAILLLNIVFPRGNRGGFSSLPLDLDFSSLTGSGEGGATGAQFAKRRR